MIIERYITDFLYFCIRIGATLVQDKEALCLSLLKNAGNIQFEYKDSIVIFTFGVGSYFWICIQRFLRLQTREYIVSNFYVV